MAIDIAIEDASRSASSSVSAQIAQTPTAVCVTPSARRR
jgi:hypothetical protein